MCGRFTLHARPNDVAQLFDVDTPLFEPRYNIAPSEVIGVVKPTEEGRVYAAVPPDGKPSGVVVLSEADTRLIDRDAEAFAEKK